MDRYNTDITNDAFSPRWVTPCCAIANQILLFDNFGSSNPLIPLMGPNGSKLFQMTIFFMLQGSVQFRINGSIIDVNSGQMLTTLPDTEVYFRKSTDDNKYLLFVIYPELLHKTYDDIYLNYDKTSFDKGYLLGTCDEEEMSLYQILYTELKKECLRPDYEYKMIAIRSYINALIINSLNLYRISNVVDIDPHSRQYDVYHKFMNALNKYAKTERTVQFYADKLNISPKYLSYVSLLYSNKNASQWISEYVIHNAKTMLGTLHYSPADTAFLLRFPSLNSFTRFFRRVTGQSPKDYANSLK
jgi:AraC-like DNA-binding protein